MSSNRCLRLYCCCCYWQLKEIDSLRHAYTVWQDMNSFQLSQLSLRERATLHAVWNFVKLLFHSREGCKVLWWVLWCCLFVCLYARISRKLHKKFSVHVACGPALAATWRCDMLFTSGFVDDVMFSQWVLRRIICTAFLSGESVTAEYTSSSPNKFCSTIKINCGLRTGSWGKSAVYDYLVSRLCDRWLLRRWRSAQLR